MSNLPGFFEQFQSTAPEPPQPDLEKNSYNDKHKSSSEHSARRKSFTLRDWEFLDFLCEHPHASNGDLSKLFETGLAAASARIKRLAEMGLLKVAYEHSEDTGTVNKRDVTVIHVPPKPWEPA